MDRATSNSVAPDKHQDGEATWERRKARRLKDIEFDKNTPAYVNYIKLVPKHERTRQHPSTPVLTSPCSRRSWDAQIKIWRIKLHDFDVEDDSFKGGGYNFATAAMTTAVSPEVQSFTDYTESVDLDLEGDTDSLTAVFDYKHRPHIVTMPIDTVTMPIDTYTDRYGYHADRYICNADRYIYHTDRYGNHADTHHDDRYGNHANRCGYHVDGYG